MHMAEIQYPVYARPYQSESDFWRVRDLLVETYSITPTNFNWEIRRWDGWRFHREPPQQPPWDKVQLWETENGRLVGAVHPEGKGDAHLQLHPDYRHIETEMVAWALENLAVQEEEGRRLEIFVFEYDSPRRVLLESCGFEKTPYGGVSRRLRFGNQPLPQPEMAPGYRLRTTRADDKDDPQRIADVVNAGFNRTTHTAAEIHNFMSKSPSFRHDLDFVAEAPDDSFAAYVGVTYDEINSRGIFEPVCTHPGHRRHGLARALMFAGMQRLKALGAADVYVETGDQAAANRLYEAVGFTEAYKGYIWRSYLVC